MTECNDVSGSIHEAGLRRDSPLCWQRPAIVLLGWLLIGLAACSSTSSSNSSGGNGACGLRLYASDYDKACQPALDTACCAEERGCAGDADCVKLVACVNACPVPRKSACINACTGDSGQPPGFAHLDAIATCTQHPPYAYPPGVTCPWPQGDGH